MTAVRVLLLALVSALGLAASPVAPAAAAYAYDGIGARNQVSLRPDADAVAQQFGLSDTSRSRAGVGGDDEPVQLMRASARSNGYRLAPNTASGGLRTVADEVGEVRSYPSYRKAQADLGTSPSSDIHHIVEQCQCSAARSGFSVSRVNSTDNLIRLPGDVHDRISAFYSSRPPGFSTTVRNTLNGMPFEQQYDFGLDVIRRAMGGSL